MHASNAQYSMTRALLYTPSHTLSLVLEFLQKSVTRGKFFARDRITYVLPHAITKMYITNMICLYNTAIAKIGIPSMVVTCV